MIGNPKWFNLRKYTGWGLSPNCWQGWAYVAIFVAPLILLSYLNLEQNIKNIFTGVWLALFLLDIFHIMSQIKKDERERLHEALADRNALWFIILFLIVYAFTTDNLDPYLFASLIGATFVKAITQIYLRDK